jgi:hypothetical protein
MTDLSSPLNRTKARLTSRIIHPPYFPSLRWVFSVAFLKGCDFKSIRRKRLCEVIIPPNLALVLPVPTDLTALTGVKFTQFLSESSLGYAGKINTFDDFRQPLTGAGLTDGFMNMSLMVNPIVTRTVPYSTFGAGFVKLHNMEPIFTLSVWRLERSGRESKSMGSQKTDRDSRKDAKSQSHSSTSWS